MSHNTLANYYKTMFAYKIHHNWDMQYIDNMIPFEMEIYSALLVQHVEEENEKLRQQQQQRQ